jgi:hypothetical protein
MSYVAEIWRVGTYLALSLAAIFGLAAGLSVIANRLARARVLNPWLWAPWQWCASPSAQSSTTS